MMWLTWRQFRNSTVIAAAVLVAVAIALAATDTHHASNAYLSHYHLLQFLSTGLVAVPALIGAFWGAPLIARELEAGTLRLVWTQSVSRAKWLAVKLGVVGSAAAVFTGFFSLMLTGWSGAAVNAGRFSDAMFGQRGIAPIGYALFAFALGATAGTLIRRTLPAMATTLVAFLAVRMIVTKLVRPLFATPLKLSRSLMAAQIGGPLHASAGSMVLADVNVNPAGHVVNDVSCQNGLPSFRTQRGVHSVPAHLSPAALQAARTSTRHCLAGFHEVLTYQPANRYWLFQTDETLVFVGLAAVLVGVCFWWIPRRLA